MNRRNLCFVLAALTIVMPNMWAKGRKKAPAVVIPLTQKGKVLEAKYAAELKALQHLVKQALPKIDEQKEAEFVAAYTAESNAMSAELTGLRAQDKKREGDPAREAYKKAQADLKVAVENAKAPTSVMLDTLEGFLASDKLDAKLVKYVLIAHATPRGLAEYAQRGPEQENLIEELLSNTELMKQMAIADGANGGKYGRALEIYAAIQKASSKAKEGVLQRLALGTALEHAVPVKQTNPTAREDAPTTVDPVKRYLHFEKAYLAGELDPRFKDMTVWDYRFVVNGDETEDALTWGRKMLPNYRPDHISTPDYRWRYVKAVKTDVRYGSQYNKFDKPELHKYQNILMNGGVCGRRAFFGRFILRAFGIPTTARPQHGHAALAHWTPKGWVVCLGANWTWGWTRTKYKEGRDFAAHTQARMTGKPFLRSLRAKWLGTVFGEQETGGFYDVASGFWNGVCLYEQRRIVEEAKIKELAAVGADIGEANESKVKDVVEKVVLTDEDKTVVVGKDGVITVPAVSCKITGDDPNKILFMDSNLGGKQLHYNRNGKPAEFEYAVVAPKAGKYQLRARVVSISPDQHLLVSVNGAENPVDIMMPLTIGMWGKTKPVEVTLVKGRNTLKCSRGGENIRGLTIRDFTLKPVE